MKMWNYKTTVFPYSLHSTLDFPAWKPKDKCYFNVFSPSIYWDNYSQKKKLFFSKLNDKCFQNLRNLWGIVNIPICDAITKIWTFLYFLLNYEPYIKDKELYDKEQKVYTNFFYIYVLKVLSPETSLSIFNKMKFLRRLGKVSGRGKY